MVITNYSDDLVLNRKYKPIERVVILNWEHVQVSCIISVKCTIVFSKIQLK